MAARLRAAVLVANIPTLLMVLIQLTGELSWLEARYLPRPAKGLDDNDSGGLPPEVQAEIRDAAIRAISDWQAGRPVAIPRPSTELLVTMFSATMAEDIPDEYGQMLAAELAGGADRDGGVGRAEDSRCDLHVLVIGAGISGLCAAVRLHRAGIAYTILERDPDLGGTWRDNRYPAAAVDTPSHLYSFSFARHDWPRYFASRAQVQRYLEQVAAEFDILPHIQFRTEVLAAEYDSQTRSWTVDVRTPDGAAERLSANVVISAVGAFNSPKTPALPGLSRFAGPSFHTSRWPEGLDIEGKKVAVVGNGASAMQVVPAIAGKVGQLTIFQRSPHWAAPFEKFQQELPEDIRFLLTSVPLYYAWYRARLSWTFNDKLHASLRRDPDWPHPERSLNLINDRYREFLTSYIRAELGDRQELLADVLPTYPPCGKRLLLDNGWYRTLTQANVRLVSDPIEEVLPDRIVTGDGKEHEVDILVFATGFDVVRFLSTLHVRGRSGRSLRDAWGDDDARAFLGLAMPDFPNFFVLYGPNTQTGHGGSLIGLVEAQMDYISSLLEQMTADAVRTVEVKQDVHDAYNAQVDAAHQGMVWAHPGMQTYYRNAAGRVVVNSPFRVVDFWRMTRHADLRDYKIEFV
jgi:4-hydroxyacetophenone monooxygenase